MNAVIAAEISAISRYYDEVLQWKILRHDTGLLLELIQSPSKSRLGEHEEFPDLTGQRDKRAIVLLNGTLNHHLDIQGLLSALRPKLSRTTRAIIVAYNPYLRWLYRFANWIGVRKSDQPFTFITRTDLNNIARLSGYEVVRIRPTVYCPLKLFGIGSLVNYLLPSLPLVRWLALATIIVLRPVVMESGRPSLSVVIPARNEKGNIENAVRRLPGLQGTDLEIIFVEGHSTDGTWDEIQRVMNSHSSRLKIKALQQTGVGKNDAVRLGFSHATGDLLAIVDADLTVAPELLTRFYEAYCQGLADFINGNRLVYSMEGEAMRFLNRLGNAFFAKVLSAMLDVRLGDSLCGTKLLARHDYGRFVAWRKEFGDFDPFGDFALLFPAAILALGIVDVPVRYHARTYGSTNISRFRHGWMLLKMTLIGLFRIKMGGVG